MYYTSTTRTLFKYTELEFAEVFIGNADKEGHYPSDNPYDSHQHPSHELHVHIGLSFL
jgi:hypothetical protein